MKKLFFLGLCLLAARSGFAWGQKGHDVTAYIAECHLTPAAAKKIDKVLGGYSPVYFANWLDKASHTPEYAYTKTWHYLNVDEGRTLDDMPANPQGDILKAVTEIVAKLRAGGLSPEEEAFNLKMLIHLLGDMHCPMHLGRATDLGGNLRPVRFFDKETNLHSVWDTSLVESAHKWSYTEWQRQIDRLTKHEAEAVAAGTPADWVAETLEICRKGYGEPYFLRLHRRGRPGHRTSASPRGPSAGTPVERDLPLIPFRTAGILPNETPCRSTTAGRFLHYSRPYDPRIRPLRPPLRDGWAACRPESGNSSGEMPLFAGKFLILFRRNDAVPETLYIKNMVCDRCIAAVRDALRRCGVEPVSVALGEALLPQPCGGTVRTAIRRELEALGFELLEDRRLQLVERIRTAVVRLVHHNDGTPLRERLSDYLTRQLGHDYSALSKLFSEVSGTTIEKYFIAQKIERAKELLRYDELSLSQIADSLGYSSAAYLSAQFKSVTGMTPSRFRQQKAAVRRPLDRV